MRDNNLKIRYFGPWAAYFFLNAIGLFLLGLFMSFMLPFSLAIFGIKTTDHPFMMSALGFILSLPISYFFFHLASSTYLIPQVKNEVSDVEMKVDDN
jgi:hypothetical protein